ncbi:MAG: hypothetical protein EBY28_09075 [Betaproteobacteria bacterium]|nr:hypothetical protein [Betaproteobacteria bacterium]
MAADLVTTAPAVQGMTQGDSARLAAAAPSLGGRPSDMRTVGRMASTAQSLELPQRIDREGFLASHAFFSG